MADQQSGDTIRQMMAGFSAMQFNLGLLPMQTSQQMAGAQFQAPPPPPPIAHPAEAAMAAMAAHNSAIQQTLQAAQMTRYQPPPSAPMPSISVMGGMSPYSGMMGGPSMGSGNFGNGGPSTTPRLPSIFNPFAPTLPAAHFASPAMRNLQIMQASTSQMMSTASGIGEGAMGLAGAGIGGALGSMLGPLGTLGGAWLGSKIGHGVASMVFNPTVQDFARGRQVQSMSAPYMVSGSSLNMATGQGFSAQAGRDVASGLRHLSRDVDFERTGFNTQDASRIMNMSAGQGLLSGANSPDQLVQKVKDISKTVKVLMRITGDPDVRDAIASLGQMRSLGFQGLAAQAGAVSNRASFARMAGVSQSAMTGMGMAGAELAGQFGLAGSTGFSAGMAGAGLANLSVSSGALNDLQLARAGGKQGLGQISAMGQLASMQDERYLLSAMGRDAKGNMTVDMNAYRKSQTMSFDEVTRRSAEALREMGSKGIFEWNTRKQEFKDQIAQKLTPLEMNLNMFRQAQAFQKQVPGMSLGTALQSTTGMSADQARALELQGQSRSYWDAQTEQLRVRRRDAMDQESAQRAQFRTAGVTTRAGRSIRGFFGDVSDTVSSPFKRLSEHFERAREDEDAADHGQHIRRISDLAIAHDADERSMIDASGLFQKRFGEGTVAPNIFDKDNSLGGSFSRSGRRELNRIGSFIGVTSTSDENRLASLVSKAHGTAFGWHPFGSFGNNEDNVNEGQGIVSAAVSIQRGQAMTAKDRMSTAAKLGKSGGSGEAKLQRATAALVTKINTMTAGWTGGGSEDALNMSHVRQAYIDSQPDKTQAMKDFDADPKIGQAMLRTISATGTDKQKEVIATTQELGMQIAGLDSTLGREGLHKSIQRDFASIGFGDFSDKAMSEAKSIFAHHKDNAEVAVMAATVAATRGDKDQRARGNAQLDDLRQTLGEKKFGELRAQAEDTVKGLSDKGSEVLRRLGGQEGRSGKDLLKEVEIGRRGFKDKMTGAAADALMEKVTSLGGTAKDDIVESLKSIQDSRLDDMGDDETASLIKAARGGDQDALTKLLRHVAPTTKETSYGGSGVGGSGVDAIDKQISDIQNMRDKLASGDAGDVGAATSQLDAASTSLFAGAVKEFVGAINNLKGHTDNTQLDHAQVRVQSQYGGG